MCMHVAGGIIEPMRTTIEIADDKLRSLREIAARRGEKGYSKIIDEALEAYLVARDTNESEERESLAEELEGAWGPERAEEVRRRVAESRAEWR